MKKHSVHEMCRVAIIAAVYVALTMVNPISWGTMQFRVANLVCVLPFWIGAILRRFFWAWDLQMLSAPSAL